MSEAENTKSLQEISEENENNSHEIPKYVYQSALARMDVLNKRIFILCIIELVIIVAMAVGFFIYESQFEDVVIEQDLDAESGTVVANGMGDLNYYGESQTDNPNPASEEYEQ